MQPNTCCVQDISPRADEAEQDGQFPSPGGILRRSSERWFCCKSNQYVFRKKEKNLDFLGLKPETLDT